MNQNLVVILCSRSNSQHKKTILSRCNNKSSLLFPLLMFCQATAWKTPYNPRGEFKITNVLAKLHRAAHVSLPNPYGWFKGWKLRNLGLNDNSPALHRKSSPMALEAWSIQLANHHKNDLLYASIAQQGFPLVLNQLLSRSPSSAVYTQAAWFFFQRPPWCSSSSQHQNIFRSTTKS